MKIDPTQISQEGLEVSEVCQPEPLLLETEDIKFLSPLTLNCRFTKDDGDVFCSGRFKADVKFICCRCGGEFNSKLQGKFRFEYPGRGNDAVLDMTDDIRQEVLLGYPLKPLCQVNCKGLCAICGQNLNEKDCGHKVEAAKKPFSQLKDLLKKREKR